MAPVQLRQLIMSAGVSELLDAQLLEHLVQQGSLAPEDIVSFVNDAAQKGNDLTTEALRTHKATEADVALLTARSYNMEPVVLAEHGIEEDLALMLTAEQAAEWRAIPFSRTELNDLKVAISDPHDVASREAVKRALPHETIKWYFALESEIELALERVYATAKAVEAADETALEVAEEGVGEHYRVSGNDSAVIRLANNIISQADREGASDIHIDPREHETDVRFRIDGITRRIMTISKGETTRRVTARIKTLADMKTDERRRPQDGRVSFKLEGDRRIDLRIATMPTIYGEKTTMRLLDQERAMLSLEALGMSRDNLARYDEAIHRPYGCAIITGPTGSGKSTTLYSSASRVVSSEKVFISIEDPVEYRLPGIIQVDVSGHGEQKLTFNDALKSTMRSDPDTIMVGEIRDGETALTAMEAALTGHFLYSTLHTNSALESVARLQRLGIAPYLVAEAVAVFVAQRLVRRLCPDCRVPMKADADYLEGLNAPAWAVKRAREDGPLDIYRARENGCTTCKMQGYKGRTGVHEVVSLSESLKQGIIEQQPLESLERMARAEGMHSIRDDCFTKVWSGTTSMDELIRVVL